MLKIVESAALAATAAPVQASAAVRRAARRAACALQRGALLPLPLLLDLDVLIGARGRSRPGFRPARPPDGRSAAYEHWLEDYVNMAARYLAVPVRHGLGPERYAWDLTPLLAPMFPAREPAPAILSALERLAAGENVEEVVRAWSGPRTTAGWTHWFPVDPEGFHTADAGEGVWSQFAAVELAEWLDERFDHEAARIFLEAANREPEPDQKRRIWRLRLRRPLYQPNPLPESYIEQDPFYGAISLTTLASAEYGEFKIVNHADQRIANPPPVRPPRTVDIHLCWAHTHASLESQIPAPAFPGTRIALGDARTLEVSVLQGFASLLFDDWRDALALLDIHLHAHRGQPHGTDDAFGRPGPRWKPAKPSSPLPPPRAVARFFSRADWLSTAAHGLHWNQVRLANSWWCLVLLEAELARFGLECETTVARDGDAGLRAPMNAIPDCFSTVVVINPSARDGALFEISLSTESGWVHLSPVSMRRAPGGDTGSFEILRLRALDALLNALEVRM